MTSWMKERDRLLEQTMAFVQGVAAQRPTKAGMPEARPFEAPAVTKFDTQFLDKPFSDKPFSDKPFLDKPFFEKPLFEKPFFDKPAEPALKIQPSDASLVEAEALMSLIAKSLPSLRSDPVGSIEPSTSMTAEPVAVTQPTFAAPLRSNAPVYVPVPKRLNHDKLPERDLIAQRVSRFRDSQLRMIRDRENNYATMQAKIRSSLGNDLPA